MKVDNSWVFAASPHGVLEDGKVAMNSLQRRSHVPPLTLGTVVNLTPFAPDGTDVGLASMSITVGLLSKAKMTTMVVLDCAKMNETLKMHFNSGAFHAGQELTMDYEGTKLKLVVNCIEHVDSNGRKLVFGILLTSTAVNWTSEPGASVKLDGQRSTGMRSILPKDFDFVKLGIGGLNNEFNQIFRRAFASRIYPAHLVEQMGIHHVRGMLLYGPPGCGKTLVARQIGKVLQAREPKIVNGPEILDKYVGEAERKLRELFADAEEEQKSKGDESDLHIVIFDEIDAICKSRGSTRDSTGVGDSIVNQLLSKIDGVDSLHNVLIIGMTNRMDMIDDALLRPGRLEVHVEIGLPDEAGRLQILTIHTSKMRETGRINAEAADNLPELATRTKNFSGAEIEGLVKSAASFAFHRNIDAKDLSKAIDETQLFVKWEDFELALTEVQPKFGAKNAELTALFRNGIVHHGPAFTDLCTTLRRLVEQTRSSERTPLMSVLLEGSPFTGKTALAASTAVESGFPFIRKLSADEMIGMGEGSKCAHISKVFMDSYKSPLSLILIDDIERIIDYVQIGPRFSNAVLQTLLVLLKKDPPTQGHKLLIMGTTSIPHLLEDLGGLVNAFNVSLHVPQLQGPDEIKTVLKELVPMSQADMDSIAAAITRPIGIKQLLMITEMARSDEETVSPLQFLECLHTVMPASS